MFNFLGLLFLIACSTRSITSYPFQKFPSFGINGFNEEQTKNFYKNLELIQEEKYSQYLRKNFILDLSSGNCRHDQISCFYPNHPETIFLTPLFFQKDEIQQMGILLHELYHLSFKSVHISCPKELLPLTDCDSSMNSAYGLEIEFYYSHYLRTKDSNALNHYQNTQRRILRR
jgi:hypothetical protein